LLWNILKRLNSIQCNVTFEFKCVVVVAWEDKTIQFPQVMIER
jgi:hypothetical protein